MQGRDRLSFYKTVVLRYCRGGERSNKQPGAGTQASPRALRTWAQRLGRARGGFRARRARSRGADGPDDRPAGASGGTLGMLRSGRAGVQPGCRGRERRAAARSAWSAGVDRRRSCAQDVDRGKRPAACGVDRGAPLRCRPVTRALATVRPGQASRGRPLTSIDERRGPCHRRENQAHTRPGESIRSALLRASV
jgi:hypothetical protein